MKITEEDIEHAIAYLRSVANGTSDEKEPNKLNAKNAEYNQTLDKLFIDDREVVSRNQIADIIRKYSRNPRFMGGRDRMFNHIKERYFGISRRDIAKFLEHDAVNQTHQPLKKKVTSRPIIVRDKAKHAQIDLIDMQEYAQPNNGDRYILTYVDLFSKWVAARRLKSKSATAVLAGVKSIINDMPEAWKPKIIQSDNGGEFGPQLENYLKSVKIKLIHSKSYTPQTQGAVERYNRELKSLIFKHMSHYKTKKWNDILPLLVDNHNTSKHNTTGKIPQKVMESELSPEEIEEIYDRIVDQAGVSASETFEKGDFVRLALTTDIEERKDVFRKKIGQNWSDDIYEIVTASKPHNAKRVVAGAAPQYTLRDLDGKKLKEKYYPYQMRRVDIEELGVEFNEERPIYDESIPDREKQVKQMNRKKTMVDEVETEARVTRSKAKK